MGDTWGVSGPVFLVLYGVGLAAIWAAIRLVRWRMGGSTSTSTDSLRLDTYDVAMLSGGEDLAAAAAMTSLRVNNVIDAGDGHVRTAFDVNKLKRNNTDASSSLRVMVTERPNLSQPVEAAVYDAIQRQPGLPPGQVAPLVATAPAVSAIRRRLVESNLLYSDAAQNKMRYHLLWYVPLLVVGLVRLAFGVSRDKPVFYLVVLLGATVWLMVTDFRVPSRTREGNKALKEMRRRQGSLKADAAAGQVPAPWLVMAMALFGTAALWESDPPLAAALGLPSGWTDGSGGLGGGGFAGGGGGGGCGGGGGGGGCGG